MNSVLLVDPPMALQHHPIGASTGYMAELRGNWDALVEEACRVSSFAVELAALSEPELGPLAEYLATMPALPFRYLSVHAPSKHRLMSEAEFVAALAALPAFVDAIVVHPDQIEDATLYRALGARLVLENMDARKSSGRHGDELEALFAVLPEAGFCFDIAHAWSVDPEMEVGEDLLDRFAARLRHVHLSSLDEGLSHESLRAEDEALFEPLLARCRDVPWLLEAPPRLI
ncbi:MAG: TIM barrel protein [Solirubrobacterales bacterium]